MKRIIAAGFAALVYSVLMPVVALAQSALGQPEGPAVAGSGGSLGGGGGGAEGVAFTGAEVTGLVLLAIALAGAGITALVLARRRTISARVEA